MTFYRELKHGERMFSGDEFQERKSGVWFPCEAVLALGVKYDEKMIPARRPVTGKTMTDSLLRVRGFLDYWKHPDITTDIVATRDGVSHALTMVDLEAVLALVEENRINAQRYGKARTMQWTLATGRVAPTRPDKFDSLIDDHLEKDKQ